MLGEVEAPAELVAWAMHSWGDTKGTYGLSDDLEGWFQRKLPGVKRTDG
jgi:hypothetical protein